MTSNKQDIILVVDDNPADLSIISEYLQEYGFTVIGASDGESSLEYIGEAQPDIILLDVQLPGIDGFETCRRLKDNESSKDIPIIFVSAMTSRADRLKAFEVGAIDFISKPLHYAEVLARIKAILNLSHHLNTVREQNKKLQEENLVRLRVRDALQESRARYRLLAETSIDMISRQTPDGIYRYVSPACQSLLGYEVHEMVGHHANKFFHPQDLETIEMLNKPIETWPTTSTITYRARKKDHSYIWLETLSKIIYDPQTNRAQEVIAVSRDVTERKQMVEELKAQNDELDAFAHTVAHDLRNPLGAVNGYAQLILMRLPDIENDQLQNMLQRLHATVDQTFGIIDALLLLAGVRKKKIETSPLNMVDIVTSSENRLALMIEEYQAQIIRPETWPTTIGYAPWVEEVWTNYLSNGLKYGGRPPQLEFGHTIQSDGMVRFWIKDNGTGLTPKEQAELFTEFTRLSEVTIKGYGLGLSIVRRIIKKLEGQVGVESEMDQGSTFYFTLPLDNTEND